jgi:uncharacterized membrane protein
MKDFLQGKWLGHPLHPILVHIPTALWPAALVFDILANTSAGGSRALVQTSFYAILFGLVVAVLAVPAGLADWWDIKRDKPAWKIGLYHMGLNLSIAVLQLINLLLRLGDLATATYVGALPLALSAISTLGLLASGYLGGMMVYDYGINIVRLSKGEWRKIAEAGGARVPPEQKARVPGNDQGGES